MRRPRDYKAEYEARKRRGLAAGKSLSASRGHHKASDLSKPTGPVDRKSIFEKALARMKRGETQKAAAAAEGVSVEKLRLYRTLNTTSVRRGKAWTIFDLRPMSYWIASKGEMKAVVVARDDASDVGGYWAAVEKFLSTNDASHLAPWVGRGVRDVNGRFHQFETWPNTLRRLDSMGDLHFLEIYADADTDGGGHD